MATVINGTDNTAATPALTGTDTDTGVFFPAANTMAFSTGGAEAMRVDSAGNLGIGTTSPASPLSFGGTKGLNATAGVPTLRMYDDGTNSFGIAASSSGVSALDISANFSAGNIRFYAGSATSSPTERMRIDSNGDLLFNSGYGSVATAYGCRAWVNFNGTGTPAIRASGNVSSITDSGTGIYTVNFTTAMPDANYAALAWGTFAQAERCGLNGTNITSGDYQIRTASSSASADPAHVFSAVFR
jgi:hypothetical protein